MKKKMIDLFKRKKNKSTTQTTITNTTNTNNAISTGKKQNEEQPFPADFDEALLATCKNLMVVVRDILKKFQKLAERDDLADDKKIELTRNYLIGIGNEIDKIVTRETSYDSKQLQNHLWHYASTYTHETGPRLQRLYNAVQVQEKSNDGVRKRHKTEDSGLENSSYKRQKRDGNKKSDIDSDSTQLRHQKKESTYIKQKKR